MTGKELKKIVDDSGIKTAELVEKSGIPQRTLYNLYEKENVEKHYLQKLSFLLPNIANESKSVPYYDVDAHAGDITIFSEPQSEYVKQYINVPAFNDCEMFINVSGNSMYPKYCAGELIALKKINDLEVVPFNEVYLVVTKEQRLLKYIRKSSDKACWLLCSENEEYESFEVAKKKVLHLYMVKGKIAKNVI